MAAIQSVTEIFFLRLAALFIFVSSAPWSLDPVHFSGFRLAAALAAAGLFLKPHLRPFQILALGLFVFDFLYRIPLTPNHDFLAAGFFTATLILIFSRTQDLVYWVRPMAVGVALVIYFFGFFQKLNLDFFNPDLSCSVALIDQVLNQLSGQPDRIVGPLAAILPKSAVPWLAWGVILLEAGLFLLILVKRFRHYGIVFALGFHFFLSPVVETFSIFMLLVLLTLLPHEFFEKLKGHKAAQWLQRNRLAILAVVAMLALGYFSLGLLPDQAVKRNVKSWITMIWLVPFYLFVLAAISFSSKIAADLPRIRVSSLAILILLFVNGLSPYFGLKTATAFSMFSNLRTEGESNHLLISQAPDFFGDQSNLVAVHFAQGDGTPIQIDRETKWPVFEIRRWIHHGELIKDPNPNQWRTYIDWQGKRLFLDEELIKSDPDFAQPISIIERKLRLFRSVQEQAVCAW